MDGLENISNPFISRDNYQTLALTIIDVISSSLTPCRLSSRVTTSFLCTSGFVFLATPHRDFQCGKGFTARILWPDENLTGCMSNSCIRNPRFVARVEEYDCTALTCSFPAPLLSLGWLTVDAYHFLFFSCPIRLRWYWGFSYLRELMVQSPTSFFKL